MQKYVSVIRDNIYCYLITDTNDYPLDGKSCIRSITLLLNFLDCDLPVSNLSVSRPGNLSTINDDRGCCGVLVVTS